MKFVRDEAHCKHESYTKTEVDELLPQKAYLKENFAVLTYEIPAEYLIPDANYSSMCNIGDEIALPSGFTKDNSVIIGKMYRTGASQGLLASKTTAANENEWTDKKHCIYNENIVYELGLVESALTENNTLGFSFYWGCLSGDKPTNDKPIYLKFLVMKVA